MSAMRGILSKINALGFVTVDPNGRENDEASSLAAGVHQWVCPEKLGERLVALAFPHGEEQPLAGQAFAWKNMPRLSLTIEARHETCTAHPVAIAQPFRGMWRNMLPELNLENDIKSMNAVAKDAMQVFVHDTVWGRKTALFNTTLECLAYSRALRERQT